MQYYTPAHPKLSLVHFQRNYVHVTEYKKKHNETHTHPKWMLCTQESVLTYIIWKLTGEADNKQLYPKQGGDRRLRKQIWVMSSKLNGKPCVRKTGESIHIYCCLDFNINIIESTSDVSLSTDWFTKRHTSFHLYLMKMKIQQKG